MSYVKDRLWDVWSFVILSIKKKIRPICYVIRVVIVFGLSKLYLPHFSTGHDLRDILIDVDLY